MSEPLVIKLPAPPGPETEQGAANARDLELTRRDQKWVADHVAHLRLPLTWTESRSPTPKLIAAGLTPVDDGGLFAFKHTMRPLSVLLGGAYHDGKRWLHASVASPYFVPSWADLVEVRAVFMGEDRRAIAVFPERRFYVNVHTKCLHLWACFDAAGDGLPEFSRHMGVI